MACCVFVSLLFGAGLRAWFALFPRRRPVTFAPPAQRSAQERP
jgi:hypothetical protein